MSTENEDGLELGALQPEWAKIQDASTDDFGVPVPAVMEAIIDNFAPAEDRYEHLELIVKTRPDGEAWFDIIHDYITQDCDSVEITCQACGGDDQDYCDTCDGTRTEWTECHCGMEMMSGMGGTLKQCFDHTTNLGQGIQPIDVARVIAFLTNKLRIGAGPDNLDKVVAWAKSEIEFEEYFENREWDNEEEEEEFVLDPEFEPYFSNEPLPSPILSHLEHYQVCNCLADSATCCREGCWCWDDE